MRVTARRFHVEVADAWESLESTLGNETIIQGRRYLQEAFKIHHRDGMVYFAALKQSTEISNHRLPTKKNEIK